MNHKTDMEAPTEIYVWFADNKGTERDGERFIRAWTMDPVRADGLRGAIGRAPAVYRTIEASQSAGVTDEPKRGTDAQILFERKLTCEAINGAIAFGYQNTNAPPSNDHWLAPFWKIGRKHAELEAALAGQSAGVQEGEYRRMFEYAVRSLAAIDEALGIDPDEAGGAAPILEAIAELKRERDEWIDANYGADAQADERWAWRTGAPPVAEGKCREFIIAVRRAQSNPPGKVFVFSASYANKFTDDGCLFGRDGDEFVAEGWHLCGLDMSGEFNEVYEPIGLNEGDEIVGWREFPKWQEALAAAPAPVSAPEQPSQDEADLCERIIHAVEGECDGLAITEEQASNILAYLQYGAPMCDMSEAFRIVDNAIGAAEECEPEGGNLRIVTLRIDAARKVRAALAAAPAPVGQSARVAEDLLPNALWTRHGSGIYQWWSYKGYEARKDTADQWVLRKGGEELYRHTYLQVVMAHAEREILAAAPQAEAAQGVALDGIEAFLRKCASECQRLSQIDTDMNYWDAGLRLVEAAEILRDMPECAAPAPDREQATLCEDGGKCGIGGYCGQCEKVRAASDPEQPSEHGEQDCPHGVDDGACDLGVGCYETGICYAMAHGQPDQCGAASAATLGEQHTDDLAVDSFARAMKEKMAAARAKGRSGWEGVDPAELSRMLREHVEKGDPRDVANFCMMLWHHSAQIASQPQAVEPKGMTGGVTVPRVLLQDLADDVEDYSASREFKPREAEWRADLLARARALLANGE